MFRSALTDVRDTEDGKIGMTLVPEDSTIEHLMAAVAIEHPTEVQLKQDVSLSILGRSFGPFVVEVSCPQALISTVGPAAITKGKPVELQFRAAEGHHWTARRVE
jgi:hypothetical protein